MTYSSAGIYGITIQVWDGDRELPLKKSILPTSPHSSVTSQT